MYIGTRSFSGEYAHFAEDVLTAYIPFLMGLFVTRAHFHIVFFWFFIRVLAVAEGHSGYCFHGTLLDKIGLLNASASANHDFHHTFNSGNFGSCTLDYLFGTVSLNQELNEQQHPSYRDAARGHWWGASFPLLRRRRSNPSQRPLDAIVCCSLFLLTCALRMTSSHSRWIRMWQVAARGGTSIWLEESEQSWRRSKRRRANRSKDANVQGHFTR